MGRRRHGAARGHERAPLDEAFGGRSVLFPGWSTDEFPAFADGLGGRDEHGWRL